MTTKTRGSIYTASRTMQTGLAMAKTHGRLTVTHFCGLVLNLFYVALMLPLWAAMKGIDAIESRQLPGTDDKL